MECVYRLRVRTAAIDQPAIGEHTARATLRWLLFADEGGHLVRYAGIRTNLQIKRLNTAGVISAVNGDTHTAP